MTETVIGSQEARRATLEALANEWHMETRQRDHYANSGDEDLAEYLHDGKRVGRYVVVTQSGDFTYLYPCEHVEEARVKDIENVLDDIYPETPRAIVDLDKRLVRHAVGVKITYGLARKLFV